jgi:hypothetical protein
LGPTISIIPLVELLVGEVAKEVLLFFPLLTAFQPIIISQVITEIPSIVGTYQEAF